MFVWLTQNIGTVVVCMFLAIAVVAIVFHMRREKRNGCSSCGCGCSGCAAEGKCRK